MWDRRAGGLAWEGALPGGGSGGRRRRRRRRRLGTASEASPVPSALSLAAQFRSGAGSWGARACGGARGREVGPGRARSAEPRRAPRPRLLTAAAGL